MFSNQLTNEGEEEYEVYEEKYINLEGDGVIESKEVEINQNNSLANLQIENGHFKLEEETEETLKRDQNGKEDSETCKNNNNNSKSTNIDIDVNSNSKSNNNNVDNSIEIDQIDQIDNQESIKNNKSQQEENKLDLEREIYSNNDKQLTIDMNSPQEKTEEYQQLQMLELLQNNLHWRISLDNKFPQGPIDNYSYEELKSGTDGHYAFKKDWVRDTKTGKMIFVNEEQIAKMKNVFGYLTKKIDLKFLFGKSQLVNYLPIDIFDTRSNLERIAFSFSFAPIYLEKAALEQDPIDQMKYSLAFLFTTSIMNIKLQKPFEPTIGETLQAYLKGCPIYMEQISHIPSIAAFQLKGRGYSFEGFLESIEKINVNSVDGHNYGDMRIHFHNTKNTIVLFQPKGTLEGANLGEKWVNIQGKSFAYDLENGLFCELQYNPKGRFFGLQKTSQDYFQGGIYRMKDKLKEKLITTYDRGNLVKFEGLNYKEDVDQQELCKVHGNWSIEMVIGDTTFWHFDKGPFPPILELEKKPLASDSIFREDIIVWKTGDINMAQVSKEKIEDFQSLDRLLREQSIDE